MSKFPSVLVVFLVFSPVLLASQPGQPLDCSDWVFLEPGYRCVAVVPFPCEGDANSCEVRVTGMEIDNSGALLQLETSDMTTECGDFGEGRSTLVRNLNGVRTEIGFIQLRCVDPATQRRDTVSPTHGEAGGKFDATGGRLLMSFWSSCIANGMQGCTYSQGRWILAIEGFTPLFEVLDSYVPTSDNLGFRAPHRPDGLRGVDHFDTYWGQVTRPLDLSLAHPLQCGYPDHQPQVGEYLSYPDAAPTPGPGQAIYYLTSVTYQGQTRAGRQAIDGGLRGRDARELPACVIPE